MIQNSKHIRLKQTTGQSTRDGMSQKAVTNAIDDKVTTIDFSNLPAASSLIGEETYLLKQGDFTKKFNLPIKIISTLQEPLTTSIFIGENAGLNVNGNIQGYANTALGFECMQNLSSNVISEASSNVSIGHGAGKGITTGSFNTIVGTVAASVIAGGKFNSIFGYHSMRNSVGRQANVAIGACALENANSDRLVAVGYGAMQAQTTGQKSVAVGYQAFGKSTTSELCTAVGYHAMANATIGANENTAIGAEAGFNITTGALNTIIGAIAGRAITSGISNTIVGRSAANAMTTGSDNVIIGLNAQATGNVSKSIVLGRSAQADSNNQFVVGAIGYEAGAITTESVTQTKTWTVKINGVNYKILLAEI